MTQKLGEDAEEEEGAKKEAPKAKKGTKIASCIAQRKEESNKAKTN